MVSKKIEKAFELADNSRDELIRLLREIICIDTCVPPGKNYDLLVDHLEPYFRELGFETERVLVPEEKIKEINLPLEGPRVNLVARKLGGREPVSICAHMDTVPIEQVWSVDPLSAVVKGDKLYGRGAIDMKGPIASLIIALRTMKKLGLRPRYDLHCLLSTDEEIGQYPGMLHLALTGYVKGHILCLELGYQDPIIPAGALGHLDVIITTVGKSGHSAMSFSSVNAIEEMVPILEELLKLKTKMEKREPRISAIPVPGATSKKMTPKLNLNVIRGGVKSNIIPSECTLVIDRRYLVEEDYDSIVAEIKEAVEKGRARSKALDVKTEYINVYPAFEVDVTSPYIKRMREAMRTVLGYKDEDFVVGGMSGSTDMAFIAQVLKTDKFIGFGPFRRSNTSAHGADEYVSINDLTSIVKELIFYLTDEKTASG